MKLIATLLREESGQDLIEYALLAALIAIVSVAALQLLGPTVANLFTRVNDAFTT
jgi:pilus assembly protein Flp/PilA